MRVPTPQGGGIAVIAATLLVAAALAGMMGVAVPLTLFGATLFIALVGFADDVRPIPVLPRLAAAGRRRRRRARGLTRRPADLSSLAA